MSFPLCNCSRFSDLVGKMVSDGSMAGNADAYVLLSDSNNACVGGVSYIGKKYGEGVCGYLPGKRSSINWYTQNDLNTALVRLLTLLTPILDLYFQSHQSVFSTQVAQFFQIVLHEVGHGLGKNRSYLEKIPHRPPFIMVKLHDFIYG